MRQPLRLHHFLLGFLLLGYMLGDKGFAYLSVPGSPLFVGDIVCLLSVLFILLFVRPLARFPMRDTSVILLMLAYAALRLAPDLPEYGVLALRDSVILTYAYVSFLAWFLIRDRYDVRLWTPLLYATLLIHTALTPVFLLVNLLRDPRSLLTTQSVPFFLFKPTDHCNFAVLTIALFVVAGRGPLRIPPWVPPAAIAVNWIFVLLSLVRGAYLGLVASLLLPAVFGYGRRILATTLAVVVGLALTLLVDPSITIGGRTLSPTVVYEEAASIFVDRPYDHALIGTKHWRLDFWDSILRSATADPRTLLFGVGNGPNLAALHGFTSESVNFPRVLRSPHSAALTVLARFGLLGLILWAAVHVLYFARVIPALRASLGPAHADLHLALWASCTFITMAFVNASFDVMLEGPQTAIWYWMMLGAGLVVARLVPRPPETADTVPRSSAGTQPPRSSRRGDS